MKELSRVPSVMFSDLRFAIRQLLKNPGFTVVAVLTLALGIGACTAVYSVVNSVLLNPVPGPDSERLMQIAEQDKEKQQGGFFIGVCPPVIHTLRANQDFFADFAWADVNLSLSRKTGDFTESVPGAGVTPNFFELWNVRPKLGRTFATDEGAPSDKNGKLLAGSVIVISYSLWQSLFGGDADVIGKSVELFGHHFTVIGVMPPHFRFPYGGLEFWAPVEDSREWPDSGRSSNYRVFVRLKPGVTEQQAQAMLDVLAQRLKKEYPGGPQQSNSTDGVYLYGNLVMQKEGFSIRIRPMRYMLADKNFVGANLDRTLFSLFGAIAFVLLVACANVANLMLTRTETRQQELAIRGALGAGRVRLIRQILTESLLLACLGGLCGLVTTVWGMRALVVLLPSGMTRLKEIQIDAYALGITLLISLGAGLAAGLAPALRASRAAIANTLKHAGIGATIGVGWRLYRGALVIAQMALALLLLAGAGLMIQNVVRLLQVKPGFDPENLLRVHMHLPWEKYSGKRELTSLFLAQFHERLAALPGVKAVGIDKQGGRLETFKADSQEKSVGLYRAGCGVEESDLFRAMRVPLLAGRYFSKDDIGEGRGTVIINETMARLCWPGEDAVGKRFRGPGASVANQVYDVVGVVGDIRDYSYDQELFPTFYRPYHEFGLDGGPLEFLVRTQADPRTLIPAIRQESKAAEPAMRLPDIRFVKQVLYDSTQTRRTYMSYLIVIGGTGVVLSALGIYGVLSYSVTRRTREIGIRMAMGAEGRKVLAMVLGEGARLIGIGVVVGLLAAFWLTRLLRNQLFELFEVNPTNQAVFASVILFLFAVALSACLLPARRAAKVDPMEALRYE